MEDETDESEKSEEVDSRASCLTPLKKAKTQRALALDTPALSETGAGRAWRDYTSSPR